MGSRPLVRSPYRIEYTPASRVAKPLGVYVRRLALYSHAPSMSILTSLGQLRQSPTSPSQLSAALRVQFS